MAALLLRERGLLFSKRSIERDTGMKRFSVFAKDEDGAVTVDWVVLTAAIVGLGISTVAMMANGTVNVGDTVDGELTVIATRVGAGTVLK